MFIESSIDVRIVFERCLLLFVSDHFKLFSTFLTFWFHLYTLARFDLLPVYRCHVRACKLLLWYQPTTLCLWLLHYGLASSQSSLFRIQIIGCCCVGGLISVCQVNREFIERFSHPRVIRLHTEIILPAFFSTRCKYWSIPRLRAVC